jgi:hypothetical protein
METKLKKINRTRNLKRSIVRSDDKPTPTILNAYDEYVKQVGTSHINVYCQQVSTTRWTYDAALNLQESTSSYSDICRGIHCDRQQCRNACQAYRFEKLSRKRSQN